jgi:hypothetical protein
MDNKTTILLVEDKVSLAQVIAKELEQHAQACGCTILAVPAVGGYCNDYRRYRR